MVYGDLRFFDIIIFAVIAVFIIYRLRSVLGKRTGFQKNTNQQEFVKKETKPDEIKIRNGQKIYTKYDTNYYEIAMKNINHQLIGIGNIKDHYMGPKRLINFDE